MHVIDPALSKVVHFFFNLLLHVVTTEYYISMQCAISA